MQPTRLLPRLVSWALAAALTGCLGASAKLEPQDAVRNGCPGLLEWSRSHAAIAQRTPADQLLRCIGAQLAKIVQETEPQTAATFDRLQWGWSLGGDGTPAIVVAFRERMLEPEQVIGYERFALVRLVSGRYTVLGTLDLREPHEAAPGSLSFAFGARRDHDGDGVPDVAIKFAELWEDDVYQGQLSGMTEPALGHALADLVQEPTLA